MLFNVHLLWLYVCQATPTLRLLMHLLSTQGRVSLRTNVSKWTFSKYFPVTACKVPFFSPLRTRTLLSCSCLCCPWTSESVIVPETPTKTWGLHSDISLHFATWVQGRLSSGFFTEEPWLICQSSQCFSRFEDNEREEQQGVTAFFVATFTAVA